MTGISPLRINIGTFDKLEDAQQKALSNKGDEAIAKGKDGKYSVFRIENLQIDNNFTEGNISFTVIGLSTEKGDYLSQTSQEKFGDTYDGEVVSDIPGVGTKISDCFIKNHKENKFSTIEDAVNAAMEDPDILSAVIFDEKTNTYSLYRVNPQGIDDIMKNKNPDKRIMRIVSPVFSNNVAYGEVRVFDVTKYGYNKEYNDLVKSTHSAKQTISIYKQDKDMAVGSKDATNNRVVAQKLIDATSSLKEFQNFRSVLSEITNSSAPVTSKNIKELSSLYNQIMEKINNNKIEINEVDKKALKDLQPFIEDLQSNAEELEAKRNEYNKSVDEVANSLEFIQGKLEVLESSGLDKGEDNVVKTIKMMMGDSIAALNTKNPENVKACALLLDNLKKYLEGGKVGNLTLKSMWNDFNNMSAVLNDVHNSMPVSQKNKNIFFAALKNLSSNPDDKVFFEEMFAKAETKKNHKLENKTQDKTDSPVNAISSGKNNVGTIDSKSGTYVPQMVVRTKEEMRSADNIKESDVEKLRPKLNQFFTESKIDASTNKLKMASIEFNKVEKKIEKSVTSFAKYIEKAQFFKVTDHIMDSLSGLIKSLKLELNKSANKDLIAEKIVQFGLHFQKKLGKDKDANSKIPDEYMSHVKELTQGVELESINKKLAEQVLDKKYMEYINSNKTSLKMLDNLKAEMKQTFEQSEEVMATKMSPKLKELRFTDISAKIGLLALNGLSD